MYYQSERTGHILTIQQAIDSGDKCSRIDKPVEIEITKKKPKVESVVKFTKDELATYILDNSGKSAAEISRASGWIVGTVRSRMIQLGLNYDHKKRKWVDVRTNQTAINTYKVIEGLK